MKDRLHPLFAGIIKDFTAGIEAVRKASHSIPVSQEEYEELMAEKARWRMGELDYLDEEDQDDDL